MSNQRGRLAAIVFGLMILASTQVSRAVATPVTPIHCVGEAILDASNTANGDESEQPSSTPIDEQVDVVPAGEVICVTDESLADQIALAGDGHRIAKHWANQNYTGDSYQLTVHGINGCNGGTKYQAPTMPPGFNNEIESSKGFSGCNTLVHFQYKDYGGNKFTCSTACSTLGSLNNAVSSMKYKP
jgi:hypothetical protein